MQRFETEYAQLVSFVLQHGERRPVRNGFARASFGHSLDVTVHSHFPLLQGRKMHYKGVLGELAAMLRQPKHINDFKVWGCNYWDKWGDDNGFINVDYGNAWFNWNGYDQIAALKEKLAKNPTDRRMIINAWRPDMLEQLSLPCCHYSYQFYVTNTGYLDMIWTQRSVDLMLGLPSDIIFAAAWLIAIANEFGLNPGKVVLNMGDVHIYDEHIDNANLYLLQYKEADHNSPMYSYNAPPGTDFCLFEPDMLTMYDYECSTPINFELKE